MAPALFSLLKDDMATLAFEAQERNYSKRLAAYRAGRAHSQPRDCRKARDEVVLLRMTVAEIRASMEGPGKGPDEFDDIVAALEAISGPC